MVKCSWALLIAAALLLGACSPSQATLPTPPPSLPPASTQPAPAATAPIPPASTQPAPAATAPIPPTAAITQTLDAAPDEPIKLDIWTTGAKQGVGTAFTYDQPAGDANPSRVWFGITGGAITEGLYPDVSMANVKSLALLVTDGKSFLADETRDATQQIERLDGRAPAFRVTSTDKAGRWATVKEIVADPASNTILFTVTFQALKGAPSDYQLYLIYTPHIGNSGRNDLSRIQDGIAEAWDEKAGIYTALAVSPVPALLTTGYTRKNDLAADLRDYTAQTIYRTTPLPGRLSIGAQLPTNGVSTIALGFGSGHDDARAAAGASLQRGFPTVAQDYLHGWDGYLDTLVHPDPSLPLYEQSVAALKTHEDKTDYGASVASLALPWGQWRDDNTPAERGYRYIWPRDLYHIAMALLSAGDEKSARATLAYLDDVLQKQDGSFPQNAFLDGTPRFSSLQMDEVADPIILAWQLKAADRYASLVKPAADFIIAHGPATAQERWEENGGYSPATLAAEVAGLVCAADMAAQAGDSSSAEGYLKTADEWNRNIETWTLTSSGPLGKGTYYLRVSDGNPNAPTKLTIANNGGAYDQRAIVDQSFLELVRLGLRKPDDPNILATLAVTDAALGVKTPKGDVYRRYPHDGYGESKPGEAAPGQGQLWPLLLGERAVYEVALAHADRPADEGLRELASFANQGGMLPEQVFPDGSGSGSATPLAWAHAEYIILANAVKQRAVPDMPAVVAQRYLK